MKIHQNLTFAFFVLLSMLIFSCSEEVEPRYKSQDILGYWKAGEKLNSFKNGLPNPLYYQMYYIEFLPGNCGNIYDEDKEWNTDIKWSVQEGPYTDKLLIAYALNSNGMSTNLFQTRVNQLYDFTIDSFKMYRFESDSIGEDLFNRYYNTYFTREE